jgi:hypothetical protein
MIGSGGFDLINPSLALPCKLRSRLRSRWKGAKKHCDQDLRNLAGLHESWSPILRRLTAVVCCDLIKRQGRKAWRIGEYHLGVAQDMTIYAIGERPKR